MSTVILGGTGSIGSYIALKMREAGDDVVIASRRAPPPDSPIGGFPFLEGDFSKGDFSAEQLRPFETVIFSAGLDYRQMSRDIPRSEQGEEYIRVNGREVPAFAQRAKQAGVRRFIHIGSFYPWARPSLVEPFPYVKSRLLADEGVRALADDDFRVVGINAPHIVGGYPGLIRDVHRKLALLALGRLPEMPVYAPRGGSHYMSVQSLYEAVVGAFDRGENGANYMVGDQNLSYESYLRLYFDAAGRAVEIPLRDEKHPLLGGAWPPPDEPPITIDPEGADVLGYRQNDIARTVAELVELARDSLESSF